MPAIVDHAPAEGGAPLAVFESGAILQYLAEKAGRFLPATVRGRFEVNQWLFWQMASLGPMAGQAGYFRNYAPEEVPHAIKRYTDEVNRLYGVLNTRLRDRDFVAGDYSIADMAIWPWIQPEWHGQDFGAFPAVKAWKDRIAVRPAIIKTAEIAAPLRAKQPELTEEVRRVLYGQRAK
jgi:GSH-dependent disulfide-bond oxidoreductase